MSYTVTTLEPPTSKPNTWTDVVRMNQNGQVAGSGTHAELGDSYYVGLTWDSTGSLESKVPGGNYTWLNDVNANGDAVGRAETITFPHVDSAIVVKNGKVVDLSPLVGGNSSEAICINDKGLVGGIQEENGTKKGFLYNSVSGQIEAWLGPLPGKTDCRVSAISNQGDVAGFSDDHGFWYSGGILTDLGEASISRMNNAGLACGAVLKPGGQLMSPVIWDTTKSPPVMIDLPLPPGFISAWAVGINSQGDVVGAGKKTPDDFPMPAFIYNHLTGVSAEFDIIKPVAGFQAFDAVGISDSGQVTCYGGVAGALTQPYILTPQVIGASPNLAIPELVAIILGGIPNDGPGLKFIGGHFHPVGPWNPEGPWSRWFQIPSAKRDAMLALAMDELAMYFVNPEARESVRRSLIQTAAARLGELESTARQRRVAPIAERIGQIGPRTLALRDRSRNSGHPFLNRRGLWPDRSRYESGGTGLQPQRSTLR